MISSKLDGAGLLRIALPCLLILASSNLLAQGTEYVIGKGDQLLITVLGYNEFTTTTTVKDNGAVTMPLLGDVQAAGMTKEAFITGLKKRLAEYIQGEIKVTVSVLSSIGQRVTILGAVTRPENYPIASEINLLELISMAGGYMPDAELSSIKIFHRAGKTQQTTEVDLQSYIERSDIENMPLVHAGDIVFVPRQENFIREFGEYFRDVVFFFTLIAVTQR